MRTVIGLLVLLGLVAAALLWPAAEVAPPGVVSEPTGSIVGSVRVRGNPVVATVEVRRVRDFRPRRGIANEWWHPLNRVDGDGFVSGDPVGTAVTAEDGSFRVDGLPPGEYQVLIRTEQGAVERWKTEIYAPGHVVRTRSDLSDTGRELFGRLSWSDGRPFRGAIDVGQGGTETTPDGRFALISLPRPEDYDQRFPIRVCRPGVVDREIGELGAIEGTTLDFVVDEGFVRMEGHVLSADDGSPLSGIPVVACGGNLSGGAGYAATRSRPDGSFTLRGLPGGWIAAGGGEHITVFRPNNPPVDSAVFRLKRRPVVTGRVIDEEGHPVPGAPVRLYELMGGIDDAPGHVWRTPIRTDDAGRFRFSLHRPGGLMVAVFGDGWMSRDLPRGSPSGYNPLALSLRPGEVHEIEIVVVPSPSVSGRVTDHEGNPVAGLRVHVWHEMEFSLRGDTWRRWLDSEPGAVTGPDGRYRVPTLVPRTPFRITEFEGTGDQAQSDWMWPDGETSVDLRLAPPYRRYVEVEVLSAADGRPLPRAFVSVDPEEESDLTYGGHGRTGPDGRALVGPLPQGPLVARVGHPEHIHRRGVAVPESGPLSVRLEPGAMLAGRVLLPNGDPAGRARVRIRKGREWAAEGATGPSGRFAFRTLKPGKYRVRAWWSGPDGGYYEASVQAETDRDDLVLDLKLDRPGREDPPPKVLPGGEIAGRVLDPDGAPVLGARVEGPKVTWTDADGRFRITGVTEEAHLLRVVGPPHLFLRDPASARPGDEEVVVRLANAAEPVVTVLDGAGSPVPRTAVSVEPPESEFEDERVCRITDPAGRVRFGGLDPERPLILIVDPPDDREDLTETEFEDWLPADRTIRLERIRTVTGRVHDADGIGVGRASLWWRKAGATGEGWEEIIVEDDGSFTADELPSAAVELMAGHLRAELSDRNLVSVTVPPGESRATIEIDGGTWIGLRVPLWPKDAKSRASLSWSGGARNLDVPASGRLRFHGLPKNKTFSLHAALPGGRMVYATKLAPDLDHELRLEQGHTISGKIIAPEPVEVFAISVYSHRIALHDQEDDDGPHDHYRIEGLPQDRYLISILAKSKGGYPFRSYKGEVRVRTGEPTDIELEFWK